MSTFVDEARAWLESLDRRGLLPEPPSFYLDALDCVGTSDADGPILDQLRRARDAWASPEPSEKERKDG